MTVRDIRAAADALGYGIDAIKKADIIDQFLSQQGE